MSGARADRVGNAYVCYRKSQGAYLPTWKQAAPTATSRPSTQLWVTQYPAAGWAGPIKDGRLLQMATADGQLWTIVGEMMGKKADASTGI